MASKCRSPGLCDLSSFVFHYEVLSSPFWYGEIQSGRSEDQFAKGKYWKFDVFNEDCWVKVPSVHNSHIFPQWSVTIAFLNSAIILDFETFKSELVPVWSSHRRDQRIGSHNHFNKSWWSGSHLQSPYLPVMLFNRPHLC